MANCNSCSGNCGGCASQLVLTPAEADFLQKLAETPFLPVARRADDMVPVYLEETDYTLEEYSLILQCLEKKQLIAIDYDGPLKGCDLAAYAAYPVRGSFALTARGQQVLDVLEIQGIQ